MGELHLEIIVDRMKREFSVEANVGAPQVAYRECIKKAVEQEGKFVKQSGGRVSSATSGSRSNRTETRQGLRIVDAVKGRYRAAQFIPAVDKGLQDAVTSGVLAGFPGWWTSSSRCLTVRRTTLTRMRTRVPCMAASMAFGRGMKKASPTLFEPMMASSSRPPKTTLGNVMGDLSGRRGMVQGMDDLPGGTKGSQGGSAAGRNVRLFHAAALADPGTCDVP